MNTYIIVFLTMNPCQTLAFKDLKTTQIARCGSNSVEQVSLQGIVKCTPEGKNFSGQL